MKATAIKKHVQKLFKNKEKEMNDIQEKVFFLMEGMKSKKDVQITLSILIAVILHGYDSKEEQNETLALTQEILKNI